MSYWAWNTAIGKHFFHEGNANKRIVFFLDQKLIEDLGKEYALGGWGEFCLSARSGPSSAPFPYYLDLVRDTWLEERADELEPPFFLVPMALLILAWTERLPQEDSFYSSFDDFLKEHLQINLEGRATAIKLLELFELVWEWSFSNDGLLGIFQNEHLQAFKYVGKIKYHALLPTMERLEMPRIWSEQMLLPAQVPDTSLLVHFLEKGNHAKQRIPTILNLLVHPRTEIRCAIQELIQIEYQAWDGEHPEVGLQIVDSKDRQGSSKIVARLCMDEQNRFHIRLLASEHEGVLPFECGGKELIADFQPGGWSNPLYSGTDGSLYEVPVSSLEDLPGISSPWSGPVAFKSKDIRIFVPAHHLGAFGTGYVESDRLLLNLPFKILAKNSEADRLQSWLKKGGGSAAKTLQLPQSDFFLISAGRALLDLQWNPLKRVVNQFQRQVFVGGKRNVMGAYPLFDLPKIRLSTAFARLEGPQGAPPDGLSLSEPVQDGSDWHFSIRSKPGYLPKASGDEWQLKVQLPEKIEVHQFRVVPQIPIRTFPAGKAWSFGTQFDVQKSLPGISSHFSLDAAGDSKSSHFHALEDHIRSFGANFPVGFDFPSTLIKGMKADGTLSFDKVNNKIKMRFYEGQGFIPEAKVVFNARNQLSAMGFFLQIPEERTVQLCPASLIRLGQQRGTHRVLMAGIWTKSLCRSVIEYCEASEGKVSLHWIMQKEAYLPPMGVLVCREIANLNQLHQYLTERFPGMVQLEVGFSYPLRQLQVLEAPVCIGPPAPSGKVILTNLPAEIEVLDPTLMAFRKGKPDAPFPWLSRSFDNRLKYAVYTWWKGPEHGYHCRGDVAAWRLLHAHRVQFIFINKSNSSQIHLPCLPLPPPVLRSLTLASGMASKTVEHFSPKGIKMNRFEGIHYALRRELPRILLGIPHNEFHEKFCRTYNHP